MRPIIQHERCFLFHGDSKDLAEVLPENSVDSMVSDPPAGISFMGQEWDEDKGGRDEWIAWLAELLRPALRALKPGGHALVWAIPRTSHWTAMALELAGFEIRDVHHHIFGTGFPKSLNISKAVDKHLGAERVVTGHYESQLPGGNTFAQDAWSQAARENPTERRDQPATTTAAWEGYGTALKPAVEHWILARKPLIGTYAENILAHRTGALNIDGCRIEYDEAGPPAAVYSGAKGEGSGQVYGASGKYESNVSELGRWPAHLSLGHAPTCFPGSCVLGCPVRLLDEQSGTTKSSKAKTSKLRKDKDNIAFGHGLGNMTPSNTYSDKGGASRFFYIAKAPRAEKDAGLDHLEPKRGGEATGRAEGSAGTKNPRAGAGRTGGARNFHPTVKSVELMRWLLRLVTPPGGIVLDVFAGSGTTGVAAIAEGLSFVGVEKGGDAGEYLPIVEGRLRHAISEYEQTAARSAESKESATP